MNNILVTFINLSSSTFKMHWYKRYYKWKYGIRPKGYYFSSDLRSSRKYYGSFYKRVAKCGIFPFDVSIWTET